jgi:hypothetical protein
MIMPVIILDNNASYIQALHRLIDTNEVYRHLITGFTELLINASYYQRLDLVWDGLANTIRELESHAQKDQTVH